MHHMQWLFQCNSKKKKKKSKMFQRANSIKMRLTVCCNRKRCLSVYLLSRKNIPFPFFRSRNISINILEITSHEWYQITHTHRRIQLNNSIQNLTVVDPFMRIRFNQFIFSWIFDIFLFFNRNLIHKLSHQIRLSVRRRYLKNGRES